MIAIRGPSMKASGFLDVEVNLQVFTCVHPCLRNSFPKKFVSICTTMHKSFLCLRKFLSSKGGKLFDAGLACSEERGDDAATPLSDHVAVCLGDFFINP